MAKVSKFFPEIIMLLFVVRDELIKAFVTIFFLHAKSMAFVRSYFFTNEPLSS